MILEFLLAFVLFVCKRKCRKIRFVGPRGTGKTSLLNYLTSVSYKTVPTLEKYSVKINNIIIEDVPVVDGEFTEKFSLDDPNYDYYFFIRDFEDYKYFSKELFEISKVYNIQFVIIDGCDIKKNNLICLNGDFGGFKKTVINK